MPRDGFLRSAAQFCWECGENNQGRTLLDQLLSPSVLSVLLNILNGINPDSRNCLQRRGWTKTEATIDAIKCNQSRCFIANPWLTKNFDDSFDNFHLISKFRTFLNKETRKRMKKLEGQQDWTRKSERWDWRWKICQRVCWRKIPVCDHLTLTHTKSFHPNV